MITGRVTRSLTAQDQVLLEENGQVLLKAYPSADGTRLRIAVPSLKSLVQVWIRDQEHVIDVTLDEKRARAELRKKGIRV